MHGTQSLELQIMAKKIFHQLSNLHSIQNDFNIVKTQISTSIKSSTKINVNQSGNTIELSTTDLYKTSTEFMIQELQNLNIPNKTKTDIQEMVHDKVQLIQETNMSVQDLSQRFYVDFSNHENTSNKTFIGLVMFGFIPSNEAQKVKLISCGHSEEWLCSQKFDIDQQRITNYIKYQLIDKINTQQMQQNPKLKYVQKMKVIPNYKLELQRTDKAYNIKHYSNDIYYIEPPKWGNSNSVGWYTSRNKIYIVYKIKNGSDDMVFNRLTNLQIQQEFGGICEFRVYVSSDGKIWQNTVKNGKYMNYYKDYSKLVETGQTRNDDQVIAHSKHIDEINLKHAAYAAIPSPVIREYESYRKSIKFIKLCITKWAVTTKQYLIIYQQNFNHLLYFKATFTAEYTSR